MEVFLNHASLVFNRSYLLAIGGKWGVSRLDIIGAFRQFAENATSRLTRQVGLATLVVVVIAEMLVLAPLYQIQRDDLLETLTHESVALLTATLYAHQNEIAEGEFNGALSAIEDLTHSTRIVGGTIDTLNGERLARFGEPLYFSVAELSAPRRDVSGDYLEGTFGPEITGAPLQISIRMNAGWISTRLAQIMWKQMALVAVLAILITIALVGVIGQIIIGPLLILRASLDAAGQDPTNADAFSPNLRRSGVLGDLSRIIQRLFHRVSQTFREELAIFAAMVNQAGDGIIAYDRDGHLVYSNNSFRAMCNADSLMDIKRLGGPLFRLSSEDAPQALQHMLQDGRFSGEVDLLIEGQQPRRCLMSAAVLKSKDGRLLRNYASLSDITAIREAQWAVEGKNRELEEANRIKSEFLAQMSHELRTPLNAIIGFSEILTNQPENESNGDVGTFARDINDSGHHLLGVINSILDLSKMEAGKQDLVETDVDITDLAQSTLAMVRKVADSHSVLLQAELPAETTVLRCDPVRLKQVLLNLLSNAIKFTDPEGTVTLSIEPANDGLVFAVRDSGIGMNPQDVPRALQPFAQIDSGISRKYEGTGLGLPISAGIVDLHGGKMEIESEKGVGTSVTFTLPIERLISQAA